MFPRVLSTVEGQGEAHKRWWKEWRIPLAKHQRYLRGSKLHCRETVGEQGLI
jgi:hypothetical protein